MEDSTQHSSKSSAQLTGECDQDRGEEAGGGWHLSKDLVKLGDQFIIQTGDMKKDMSALEKKTQQTVSPRTSLCGQWDVPVGLE